MQKQFDWKKRRKPPVSWRQIGGLWLTAVSTACFAYIGVMTDDPNFTILGWLLWTLGFCWSSILLRKISEHYGR